MSEKNQPAFFANSIREQGYRMTPQRQLILEALCNLGGHATVEEIYEQVQATAPTVNLATIYRTVNFLEELRLIVSAQICGQTIYEIAPPTPHHHLVCRACGHVTTLADDHLQQLIQHLADEHHFQAEIDHLAIHGLCEHCQNEASRTRCQDA